MSFIRLSDDYVDHPKFAALGDGSFRLWHQGLAYCRKFKTDGLIPTETIRGFRSYSPKRMRELMAPWCEGANPLWIEVKGFGVRMHDYLGWNLSKEEEGNERAAANARMRKWRASRDGVTSGVTNAFVPGTDREGNGKKALEEEESPQLKVQETFRAQWTEKYGVPCSFMLTPIQYSLLDQQVAECGTTKLLSAIPAYLADKSDFVRNARHPFPLFLKDPMKYLVKLSSHDDEMAEIIRNGPSKR